MCKFGPGGDFITEWTGQTEELSRRSANGLLKVLNTISDVMTAVVGPGPDTAAAGPSVKRPEAQWIFQQKGKLKYAVENTKTNKPDYPAPATVIKCDRPFSNQSMLFPHDGRISIRTGHKPKHRIRAYRGTAKKTPALDLAGQGSLFEPDFKGARTA